MRAHGAAHGRQHGEGDEHGAGQDLLGTKVRGTYGACARRA